VSAEPHPLSVEIRKRHTKVEQYGRDNFPMHYCAICVEDWPCDAIRAADALDEMQERLRALTESPGPPAADPDR
jgi:hypothetical protein